VNRSEEVGRNDPITRALRADHFGCRMNSAQADSAVTDHNDLEPGVACALTTP
jgi:hypothetical protein